MTGVGVFDAKLTTPQLSTGLLVMAYLLTVVDGTLQDKGLYPSSPGRTGLRMYAMAHPWIVAGAACGVAGTVLAALPRTSSSPCVVKTVITPPMLHWLKRPFKQENHARSGAFERHRYRDSNPGFRTENPAS